MFTAKYRDNERNWEDHPGHIIWETILAIAKCQCGLHNIGNPIGVTTDEITSARNQGRLGNPHWASYTERYAKDGFTGFCTGCRSHTCAINRSQICTILALYTLILKINMFWPEELYVTDLGIPKKDIEYFLAHFVTSRPGSQRYVKYIKQTIPNFRDSSRAIYQGDTIDITKLSRPEEL